MLSEFHLHEILKQEKLTRSGKISHQWEVGGRGRD